MKAQGGAGTEAITPEPLTPGAMLRAQRERCGLTVQQAAEELHLDGWVIEALEANRFPALGAPVYAKGHLRKYAAVLGLAPEEVIGRYEALESAAEVPAPIPTTMSGAARAWPRPFPVPIGVVAAIVAVAGLTWLVFALLAPQPADIVTGPIEPPVTPAATDALPAREPAGAQSVERPIAPPTPPPQHDPPPGSVVSLRLEFSGTSWAEVYDARGQRLMFDMGVPGRTYTIVGVPPLRVRLGFAAAVSARLDDRPIIVPRRAGRDATRFVIEKGGSVRMEDPMKTPQPEVPE